MATVGVKGLNLLDSIHLDESSACKKITQLVGQVSVLGFPNVFIVRFPVVNGPLLFVTDHCEQVMLLRY